MSNHLALSLQAALELPNNQEAVEPKQTTPPTLQTEVQSVFESYATLYPNPRLAQERQERESLIRALAAADEATQRNPTSSSSPGLWGRLFGSGSSQSDGRKDKLLSNFDESRLKYVNEDDENEESSSGKQRPLCGTENYSLDLSCIPPEAYMVARFQITSRHRGINVARNSWERAGTTMVIITGLGQVVEVPEQQEQETTTTTAKTTWSTSDCRELRDYVQREGLVFAPERARAAMIGPFFLMVSWGLFDGTVMCYRKVQRNNGDKNNKQPPKHGWQAMARIGPTQVVQSKLVDIFGGESEDGPPVSPLLTVTDIVPLVVETGPQSAPDISLAISRLGGYIEIVPLPSRLWYGQEVPPRKSQSSKRYTHYGAILKDLAEMKSISSRIVALSTLEYHGDIMGMDAFRTRVKNDTAWDQGAYPDRPPAEYVLVAHGCDPSSQTEQLSFWAVSTLFNEEPDPKDEVGFSLHATLAEVIDLGPLVPQMTLFASDAILKHWRKPRHVELRESSDISDGPANNCDKVTTISIPMPLLTVRAALAGETTMLTVLDGFGGVALLDCSLLERLVSQCLSPEERHQIFGGEGGQSIPLADFLFERTFISRTLSDASGTCKPSRILDVDFLPWSLATMVNEVGPVLALLDQRRLYLISVDNLRNGKLSLSISVKARKVDGCRLHVSARGGLTLLFRETHKHLQALALSSLQNGSHLVERMIREGKYLEAVKAADSMNAADRSRLKQQLEECHKRIWEKTADVESFSSILDESYQLTQAMAASEGKLDAVNSAIQPLNLIRRAIRHVMSKLRTARLGSALTIGGVDGFIRRLRQRYILLGTYELLSQLMETEPSISVFATDVLPLSLSDLALAFARQANMEALSIIYYRHLGEVDMGVVFQAIPAAVEPQRYQHLVPVTTVNGDLGPLFISGLEEDELLPLDSLDFYVYEHFTVGVCIDEEDKSFVTAEIASMPSYYFDRNRAELSMFMLQRAHLIESSCASLELTVGFCNVALRAVRHEFSPLPDSSVELTFIESNSSRLAGLLCNCAELDTYSSHLPTITSSDFGLMDVSELTYFVLRMGLTPSRLSDTLQNQIRPLVKSGAMSVDDEFDTFLSQSCQTLLSYSRSSGEDSMLHSLNCARTICSLSKSSIKKSDRLLKKKETLLGFIVGLLNELFLFDREKDDHGMNTSSVVNTLWSMYECLPVSTLDADAGSEEFDQRVDNLRLLLVVGDIACKWPTCQALDLVGKGISGSGSHLSKDYRDKIIRELCVCFLDQLDSGYAADTMDGNRRLSEVLVLDIQEILSISSPEASDEVLTGELFLPLLQKMHIPVLRHLLSVFGTDLFDFETMQDAIVSFSSDAVFSSEASRNVEAAIACEQTLGEFFPNLESHFESIRQCLNAAHFINSVLFVGSNEYMTPETIKQSSPLDVIYDVLSKNPDVVLKDCEEWNDEEFAERANLNLCRAERPQEPYREAPEAIPRLPCVAVFHLAEVLGLLDETSVILVKSLVIIFCVKAHHCGAAAAICRTLFAGRDMNSFRANVVLGAVSQIVRDPEYRDKKTKLELCNRTLVDLSETEFALSGTCGDDCKMSVITATLREIYDEDAIKSNSFPLKSMHVANNPEISDLLLKANQTISGLEVDPKLLTSLGKALLKGFVTSILSTHAESMSTSTEELINVLDLGLSLLMHCRLEKEATQPLDEIEAVLESNLDSDHIDPSLSVVDANEDIVKKLIGRGYSEDGARRSVVMTGNAGFKEALGWAVTHSLEPGFDDPIAIVGRGTEATNCGILKMALSKIKGVREMISQGPSFHDFSNASQLSSPNSWSENKTKGTSMTAAFSQEVLKENGKEKALPPSEEKESFPRSLGGNGSYYMGPEPGIDNSPARTPKLYGTSKEEFAADVDDCAANSKWISLPTKSSISSTTDLNVAPRDQSKLGNNGAASLAIAHSGEDASAMVPRMNGSVNTFFAQPPNCAVAKSDQGSPSDPASRDALRKMGLDALKSARAMLNNGSPGMDERRRLIEEGRRLLELSRSRKSPDTNISNNLPSEPKPGLRSNPVKSVVADGSTNFNHRLFTNSNLWQVEGSATNGAASRHNNTFTTLGGVAASRTIDNYPQEDNLSADEADGWDFDEGSGDGPRDLGVGSPATESNCWNSEPDISALSGVPGNHSLSIAKPSTAPPSGWDFDDGNAEDVADVDAVDNGWEPQEVEAIEDDGWDFDDNI